MQEPTLRSLALNPFSRKPWERIGTKRRAGVLVPLFTVYSKKSIGIGEIGDIKLLIDWALFSGHSIVQFLPMNELGGGMCPYDAQSSFALEPAYISLDDMAQSAQREIQEGIRTLRNRFLSPAGYVNYAIKEEKLKLLRKMFLQGASEDSLDLKKFKEENRYWLSDFALYKALKEYHAYTPWYEWEERFKNRDTKALEDFSIAHEKEISFFEWVQWELFKQFTAAAQYAKENKVLLKGDLPILVSLDSADVWANLKFFKPSLAAGAPPDMYCAKGQRWGMPTYDWGHIAADGFTYIKEKLAYAQNFYDILRIDHVVGFFRIWSIPVHEPLENKGLNGFFDPKDEALWQGHGAGILKTILENTRMLLCAEDLGVIPKVCTETLRDLGIPGNDVQRWRKDWEKKHDFLSPLEYRLLAVSMLSTHDTTNWPAWWEFEAGTVDEDLFERRCAERGIEYARVRDILFDPGRCRYARLRWRLDVDSVDKLVRVLGKKKEDLKDFIDFYKNTFLEKEKLWKRLGLPEPMQEKYDAQIMRRALNVTLESQSIFCINTLVDLLFLADIFPGDPYQYRVNTPGTMSEKNWSLVIPLSLEELLANGVTKEIRSMIAASGRL